jgi:hypothetical protein
MGRKEGRALDIGLDLSGTGHNFVISIDRHLV